MELQLNAFYRFKFKDWKERISGMVVAQDENWILIHFNPADFMLDGFKLLRRSHIASAKRSKAELRRELVTQLKNLELPNHWSSLKTDSTLSLLKSVEASCGIVQFEDNDEELLIGKIKTVDGDNFTIDFLDSKGRWIEDYDLVFSLDAIDVITFETDYLQSLKLLSTTIVKAIEN
jgi:hypothetical protein